MELEAFLDTPRGRQLKAEADTRVPNPNAKKYQPRGGEPDSFLSPNFGDGGWHTTPGCQEFVKEWQPLADRIMVMLFPVKQPGSGLIVAPESAAADTTTRRGIVLKCGPGKWITGSHRRVGAIWRPDANGIQMPHGGTMEWEEGYRRQMQVKPGMLVSIGRFHDWRSLDAGFGEEIVICQEADVRVFQWPN